MVNINKHLNFSIIHIPFVDGVYVCSYRGIYHPAQSVANRNNA